MDTTRVESVVVGGDLVQVAEALSSPENEWVDPWSQAEETETDDEFLLQGYTGGKADKLRTLVHSLVKQELSNISTRQDRIDDAQRKQSSQLLEEKRERGKMYRKWEKQLRKSKQQLDEISRQQEQHSSQILTGVQQRDEIRATQTQHASQLLDVQKEQQHLSERLGNVDKTAGGIDCNANFNNPFNLASLHNLEDGKAFYQYFPLWFDGSTGNNGYCPVNIIDHSGTPQKLVAVSLPATSRFMAYVSNIPRDNTKNFLNAILGKVTDLDLNHCDKMNACLQAGFKVYSKRRTETDTEHILVKANFWKWLIKMIEEAFPQRPRSIADIPKRKGTPNYKRDGFDFGFKSKPDEATGPIQQLGGDSIPAERKRTLPVMGEPWVQDWYTPAVGDFFDIPANMLGSHHVVCSVVDTESKFGPVQPYLVGWTSFMERKRVIDRKSELRKRKRVEREARKKATRGGQLASSG